MKTTITQNETTENKWKVLYDFLTPEERTEKRNEIMAATEWNEATYYQIGRAHV